ncbi:MBOAT family O-acyltransferase [Planctomycetota bacterium]
MLFNSLAFGIFFPTVFLLYLVLPRRGQNIMLLAASYFFYAQWDWRFLSLILISTCVDYYCGIKLDRPDKSRARIYLLLSVLTNLLLLGFFKYCNFFIDNLHSLLLNFGLVVNSRIINVVVPVGISFYTFQTMSYTIDIYRGKLGATRSFTDFALFVAFFPQLVAGPIERAKNLLPQIARKRRITAARIFDGGYLIFWGLFKKVFVADNLAALVVDPIFGSGIQDNGLLVVIGVYAFAFQIYCDFSGYTDIARGCAKMMGFDLMLNFKLPYFAVNPSDFWSRWHISLSTWLRDYLYIPMGGNRAGRTKRNLLYTMLLGGLWHGAQWKFVLWGLYQGLLLIGHRIWSGRSGPAVKNTPLIRLGKIIIMFQFTCLGWLIFAARDFRHILELAGSLANGFRIDDMAMRYASELLFFAWPVVLMQLFQYKFNNLDIFGKLPWFIRSVVYVAGFYLFIIFGEFGAREFIYFQF